MAKEKEREFLGVILGKSFYWNFQGQYIEWSVPSPRAAIVAPPGYVVLSADYSQIEVKLMAYLSGDPILIEAINSGLDVHSFNAVKVFGCELNFTYEELEIARSDREHPRFNELSLVRSRIKSLVFGIPYGIGVKKVAIDFDVTEQEAKELIDAFLNTFFVLKQWLIDTGLYAIEEGYSNTIIERKRFYRIPSSSNPALKELLAQIKRWAGNAAIQGSNADILKIAMVDIYKSLRGGSFIGKKLYDAWISLVVHDEIMMICAEKDVEVVKEIMKTCMNNAYYNLIPRPGQPGWVALGPEKYDYGINIDVAKNWAEAH